MTVRHSVHYLASHGGFRESPIVMLWRLWKWRVRSLIGRPGIATLSAWDVKLHLPAMWRGVAKTIYVFRDRYEPELLLMNAMVRPGELVVDVGACFGIYTIVASRLVGDSGKVVAIEPSRQAFEVLERNILSNGCTNVVTFGCALSDKVGRTVLHHHPDISRFSLGGTGAGEDVETTTLDRTLPPTAPTRSCLLKIDVEGAEELVLRGALKTLDRDRPVVMLEVNPEAARALGLDPLGALSLLGGRGYGFYLANAAGGLEKMGTNPTGGNVLAIHPSNPIA